MAKLLTSLPDEVEDLPGELRADSPDRDGDPDDDRHHAKLLDAISSLDGKRLKHTLRTEPGREVSEFGFTSKKDDNKVLLSELMNSVNSTVSHTDLKKQLKESQKNARPLPAPLPRHERDKIQRTVGYEKAVAEVSKWDSVVHANRKADQLVFPLHQPNTRLVNSHFKFKPRTPLEMEIAAALKQQDPQNVIKKNNVLTPAEEKALAAMSLEEARERRAELLKYRALLYNRESKLRWQNKIKSKRYRRMKKKEKQKQAEKELEELARTDPEAFLERMDKADLDRIQERMRLRHRGGGRFARQAKMYAKFDDKKREEIQEMLRKGKELKQKVRVEESESEEEEDNTEPANLSLPMDPETVKNPWMQAQTVKVPELSRPQPVVAQDTEKVVQADDSEDEMDEIDRLFADDKERKKTKGKGEDEEFTKVKRKQRRQKEKRAGKSSQGKPVEDEATTKPVNGRAEQAQQSKGKGKQQTDAESKGNAGKPAHENGQKQLVPTPKRGKKQAVFANPGAASGKHDEKEHSGFETDSSDSESDDGDEADLHEDFTETLKKSAPHPEQESDSEEEAMLQETTDARLTEESLAQLENTEQEENLSSEKPSKQKKQQKDADENGTPKPAEFVDPKKLLSLKSKPLKSRLEDADSDEEDDSEEEDVGNRLTIAEAFEDDDVVAEFGEEKKKVVEEEKEKDIDLTLPGWGEWGGVGLETSKKKKKKFTIKAKKAKRTDKHLGHVIISEKKNPALEKHLVTKLPFPYKSPADFSATMKTPVGREWNTENAFKRMTKPAVIIRAGTIIEPVDESMLLKKPAKRSADVDMGLDVGKSREAKKRKKHQHHGKKEHQQQHKKTKQQQSK